MAPRSRKTGSAAAKAKGSAKEPVPSPRGRKSSPDGSAPRSRGSSKKDAPVMDAKAGGAINELKDEVQFLIGKRRFALLFGVIFGIVFGAWLSGAQAPFVNENEMLMDYVAKTRDVLSMTRSLLASDSSAGFGLGNFEQQAGVLQQLKDMVDFRPKKNVAEQEERVGLIEKKKGLKAKHPVVMIPGIVTSGLELWSGEECAKSYFRQRMWGTMTMVQIMMLNTRCWLRHMALDHATGMDKPNIKLRPAQGFESADYLVGGYWVWGKLIENLADIGYDPSLMHMASYDWRLPFQLLEKRDQYFTRLSFTIEAMVHGSGHKAVVIVHSMGGNVFLYFTRWATVHRGEDWVNKYIHGFVSLATPFLGVPKGVAALLSGEAKDTAEMGVLGSILDRHMSRWERRRLFRSWGSTPVMLPKGGDAIWGRRHHPALDFNETETTKAVLASSMVSFGGQGRTASETIASLLDAAKAGPETDGRLANYEAWHSHGLREGDFLDGDYFNNSRTWANPLESQLPNAPDLKIFCLYGIGQPTERAYMYTRTEGYDEGMVAAAATAENLTKEEAWEVEGGVEWRLDTSAEAPNLYSLGIIKTEGDGSVPLISAGFMCARGWKTAHFNPGGAKVLTREYQHLPSTFMQDLRGGSMSADHVDILGNDELLRNVLAIAAGEEVEERVLSNIKEMSARVVLPPHIV